MISGSERRAARWLAVVGLAFAVAPAAAGEAGLPALMAELSKVRAAHGSFAERQSLHMLSAPLLSRGTLTYRAPDYLRRTTTAPTAQDFVLDHGEATLSVPGAAARSFAVAGNPEIGAMIEGIRATLAGDLPALEKYYTVRLAGPLTAWQLTLRPRDPAMARLLTWIVITGDGARLTAIDSLSANGDHAEMGVDESLDNAL